ncbi:MAG TPA: hypothetical protein VGM32_09515 [Rhodopila sp.]
MYRCYLIHRGRIAKAEELAATTLAEAITQGRNLLLADSATQTDSGIEIWAEADLCYSDRCHAGDTGNPDFVTSPFQTADFTTMPTWRRSTSRSLASLTFT